jgi:hypothetical protein
MNNFIEKVKILCCFLKLWVIWHVFVLM